MAKEGFDIPASVEDVKYRYILAIDHVYDDVTADGKASQAGAQILAVAPHIWVTAQCDETVRYGVDYRVGNLDAGCLFGDIKPDAIQINIGLLCYAVRHQLGVCCSAARRERPRCFTSSASCRMEPSVTIRPLPAASEALALSMAARISARRRSRSS